MCCFIGSRTTVWASDSTRKTSDTLGAILLSLKQSTTAHDSYETALPNCLMPSGVYTHLVPHPWYLFGTPVVPIWYTRGTHLVHPWYPFGTPVLFKHRLAVSSGAADHSPMPHDCDPTTAPPDPTEGNPRKTIGEYHTVSEFQEVRIKAGHSAPQRPLCKHYRLLLLFLLFLLQFRDCY